MKIRRSVVVSVVALLVVGLVALGPGAQAGKKKKKKPARIERVVEMPYTAFAAGHPNYGYACLIGYNCGADFFATPEENYVTVEAKDATGLPVAGYLYVGGDYFSEGVSFCGKTEEAALLLSGEVGVRFYATVAPNETCTGLATEGTVVATFSNLP